jgi:ATP-binding cassette subfamily B protein
LFAFEEEANAFIAAHTVNVIQREPHVNLSEPHVILSEPHVILSEPHVILSEVEGSQRGEPEILRQARDDMGPFLNTPGLAGIAIRLRDVSFAYPGSQQRVICDVSLSIARGETIAIVGENGAGKSTLIRLITGLYLPDAGTVTLDGVDTRTGNTEMHRIGAVFQDYLAYQLPLRDNITFGDPTRTTEHHHLERAARQAGIAELVEAMPEGFDTWLGRQFGERDLSGGQWQRVALARALYRDADLLILDEPTAALDPKAEQALFERFASLVEDRTAVMISHRLASARFADRILVMDRGCLVEQGSHDALIRQGGLYARMFAAQAEWYR